MIDVPELKLSYLAAPYSHPDKAVVEARIEKICRVDAKLMKAGIFTVSPLLKHFTIHHADLPGDYKFWKDYSDTLLCTVDQMIVIMLDGWDESVGVAGEIKMAIALDIPVLYVTEDGDFVQ